MANEREFTLVGKFDDQITKKLKAINEELGKLAKPLKKDNVASSLVKGFEGANKEIKSLQKELDQVGKFKMKFDKSGITAAIKETETLGKTIKSVEKVGFEFDRSGIKAAIEDVEALGKQINSTSKAGFEFDRSGIKAAQEDAKVLGDILKANALIQVGQGFANALTAGATAAVGILQRGVGFVSNQFQAAVQDQMEDLQARGSLFGALNKAGVLKGGTAADLEAGYRQTKVISRANEQAIGELIRTSSVSTGVVTTLNRQMTDNLLPTLLKARGITSLTGMSRQDLDKLFGGEPGKQGIGTDLARLYEQMATVIPNPAYASMAAMGFTQVITSGTINRQLNVFENNPVLVDALKTIDGGIQGTSDIGKRIQILRKALEIAAPTMMLDEMRQTIGGGLQAVQDTVMNPTVGILSMGADIANEGKRTLEQYKASGAFALQRERTIVNLQKEADKRKLTGIKREEFINKHLGIAMEKLSEAVESADSPIEKISVGLAPVLQSFATFLNTFGNLLIGPVTSAMNELFKPMAALQRTLEYLSTDIELFSKTGGKEGRSLGNALGRAFAEIFKTLAQYFNPQEAGKNLGDGINTFFDDFMKGFKGEGIDGSKYLKIVMGTLQSILMKLIFKEGDITKGLTGLGDALAKVFALLAAPAFVSALITGLVPIALSSMGGLITSVFTALGPKVLPGLFAKAATSTAAAGAAGAAGAGAGAAGAAGSAASAAGGLAALLTNPLVLITAAAVAAKVTEPAVKAISPTLQASGEATTKKSEEYWKQFSMADQKGQYGQALGLLGLSLGEFIKGEFIHVANDFMLGFNQVFAGLADLVVGLFSDPKKVSEGIQKIFMGLGRLITMVGHAFLGVAAAVPGLIVLVLNAVKNLILGIAMAIEQAWKNRPRWMGGNGGAGARPPEAGSNTPAGGQDRRVGQTAILGGKAVKWSGSSWVAAAKGSDSPFYGNLGQAINYEMRNKPVGSHLVIANSSETIIPAAGGFGGGMQGVIAAVWGAAQQMSSSIARDLDKSTAVTVTQIGKGIERMSYQTSSTFARGFTSMQSSLRTGQAETTRAIEKSLSITSRQNQQLLMAVKAAAAAGGFGKGMVEGMSLGGGYGGAGVRIAGMLGNFIKATGGAPGSIWEHPWHGGVKGRHSKNSYHYSGRAIDIGAYANEQAGVIARIQQFNAKYGVRPVEFLHAGNDKGHQDHVHVAYAYGPGRPALFANQKDAVAWEKKNIPPNLQVRSVTTNSREAMGPGDEAMGKLSGFVKVMSAVGGNLCALMGTNRSGADTGGSFTGSAAGINQLIGIAKSAGFSGRSAAIMAAIAMAESGGNPMAHNSKPPDNSYGLWQINMLGALGPERRRQFGLRSNEDLFNPATNARAAFAISGGGTNFTPWSVYTSGAYRRFLPALDHVAYALGPGRPAFFSSKASAEAWEKKMIPSSLKVKTLTTNTGEMATGGPTTINAPITIYQQPNQDAEQLASIVAYRIGLAVSELRNHA